MKGMALSRIRPLQAIPSGMEYRSRSDRRHTLDALIADAGNSEVGAQLSELEKLVGQYDTMRLCLF